MAEDPWATFRTAPVEDDPWAAFRAPTAPAGMPAPETPARAAPPAVASEADVAAAERATGMTPPANPWIDAVRAAGSGLSSGVTGLLGLPADAAGLAIEGADRLQAWRSGRPVEAVRAENNARATVQPSTIAQAGSASLQSMSPVDYKPETRTGKYIESVASFAPAALAGPAGLGRKMLMGAAVPGVASEGAGQLTAGTPMEPWARFAAALAAPSAVGRIVSPLRTPAAKAPLVEAMEREGVQLTAGQKTGSKALQYAESSLGDAPGAGGKAADAMDRQGRQFTQAAARRIGSDADLLTPEARLEARNRIGGRFEELSGRNTLSMDPTLAQDMVNVRAAHSATIPTTHIPAFDAMYGQVRDAFVRNAGQMDGRTYQTTRSRLDRMQRNATDGELKEAYKGMRNALDDAMERSIPAGSDDAAAWREARQQWGALKTIDKAMNGAGERTAQGFLSPAQLRAAAASGNPSAFTKGQSDLGELARAGVATMTPLPQSGTAPRFLSTILAGGGGAAGGLEGALVGALAPAAAGRALMLGPVQSWLGNRRLTQGEGLLAAALRGHQGAVAQPEPLALRVRSRP